jgi:hypothetical protein
MYSEAAGGSPFSGLRRGKGLPTFAARGFFAAAQSAQHRLGRGSGTLDAWAWRRRRDRRY